MFGVRIAAAQPAPRLIHVFVALADNVHQGIVPVPAVLGNGDDPAKNLYWGAAFGVRTYFKRSAERHEVATIENPKSYVLERSSADPKKNAPVAAALSVYVAHDGLMDFTVESRFQGDGDPHREAIVLACASKMFFANVLKSTGAQPLLWTTGLMAPEAYTLKAALDGWIAGESASSARERAAAAYAKYQKCSIVAAARLFSSGW